MIRSVINKTIFGLIIISCLCTLTAHGQDQSSPQLAYKYYNDQEWSKAGPLFLKMYEENGAKPYLNYYVRCLVQLKDYDTAEKTLTKYIRKTGDQSLYIDIAYLSEIQGNNKKADEEYLKPFKKFPQTTESIKALGSNYLSYLKYEYAQQVYEIGRQMLNAPDEFHLEMASVFMMQRNYPMMLEEYLSLLISQPRYLRTAQSQIRSAMTRDVDETLLENAKSKTLEYIQRFPGLDVFNELLIWIYLQEENYDKAIDLAVALDRRNKETGERLLDLARSADEANVFDAAIKAYKIIISKDPPNVNPASRKNALSKETPFIIAQREILKSTLSLLESEDPPQYSKYLQLSIDYGKTIKELGVNKENLILLKELAYIQAFRLNEMDTAINTLNIALETPGIAQSIKSELYLDKADIVLSQNDPWEATLIYARVEKENAQNPIGSLAKYKKALLAYYTGNFDWAKIQLDVLKGSTSKLIANDAFELSLLIRENLNWEDSLNLGLTALSRADYLFFQKKTDSALLVLDSLIMNFAEHPVADDALFKKAEICLSINREDDAITVLQRIKSDYLDDIWGHKALYFLGKIYEGRNEKEKSIEYYQQLLDNFPNSFYNLDSRNHIRNLRKVDDIENHDDT